MLVPGPIDAEDGRILDFKLERESLLGVYHAIRGLVPGTLIVGGGWWEEDFVTSLGRVVARCRLSIVEDDTFTAVPSSPLVMAERQGLWFGTVNHRRLRHEYLGLRPHIIFIRQLLLRIVVHT